MQVELKNVSKRFGSVLANQAVSLQVHPGEVLALLGENGAGKSTLMKVLFGLYPPEEGEILIDGKPVQFQSPRDAMAIGIGMVFQQFNLIQPMTVLENLLLAFPRTDLVLSKRSAAAQFVLERLNQFAPEIDPHALVSTLSVGQKQLIELAKVLNLDARLVILDEPTSVLPPQEQERL
ncbi:MAG TPA: ATP-binding cassette domain-containing protein, partial [Pseudomonadales bacterium]|nr:ATP-binding cassette domain-containing protein [Pseudomonadales bacterium]